MEQKELNNTIIQNENDISELKGKLDSLATKEFVQDAIARQTDKIEKQIARQTDKIENQFEKLSEEINKGRDWRNLIVGGGMAIVLLITVVTNLLS